MAGATLFTLIDDIASLLDDISVMTKVAVKNTAGVLGDDLALNAHQVSGVASNRELPVVWSVAKGSLVNKTVLVPLALAVSFFAPKLVLPLLMLGGIYLCYEGVEKLVHKWLHGHEKTESERAGQVEALKDPDVDLVGLEKDKIRGAIRTDFILSAEIIVISLGAVAKQPFLTQVGTLIAISLIMTVGVYGLVGGIVKLDDLGLALIRRQGNSAVSKSTRAIGRGLLWLAPYLLKFLSLAGTVAMFLVGGSIIVHAIGPLDEMVHYLAEGSRTLPVVGWLLPYLTPSMLNIGIGLIAGAIVLVVIEGARRWIAPGKRRSEESHHSKA